MTVIYAPNFIFNFVTDLELDDVRREPQFLLSISKDRGPHSMPHEVPLVSEVDEVVVDGGGVDVTGHGAG